MGRQRQGRIMSQDAQPGGWASRPVGREDDRGLPGGGAQVHAVRLPVRSHRRAERVGQVHLVRGGVERDLRQAL
eukprot:2914918-Pyramimonas_sp.AAC.1